MFSIPAKYILPPRRENWVAPTPKPRKKQVNIREPIRTTQKQVVQPITKPNLRVPLSTGVKSASGVSKPTLKHVRNMNRSLQTKEERGERVEDHPRNLNKKNHNHDNCVVKYLRIVNSKRSKAKKTVVKPKQVWKPVGKSATMTQSQWKPTGSTDRPLVFGFWMLKAYDRSSLEVINYVDKFIGTVRFGNDEFATIVGYGDYKLGDTIILRVYYVEGLTLKKLQQSTNG
nr:integrase, catalytic region, zinc finger, CCHC-type, peptidase aspartic, catalytic [Tanacetum cinerariifolium]